MLSIELSQIKSIEAEVLKHADYISLSQGALRVGGIPEEIKLYLREVLRTDKTDYYQSAWGIMPLREKIAETLGVSHKHVLVSHGCMGALSTLLTTLVEKGEEVILPEPTYPAYKNIVRVVRGKPVFVSCKKSDFDWELQIDAIKAARTDKTRAVLFSNPCNPTGEVIGVEKLQELIRWCETHGIYLIVDESYDDYIFDETFCSVTSFVPHSEFVIRTGSYSKSLSMSGWRVGFMVVPETLSCMMGITQDALLNCPNVIAQYAALFALDYPAFRHKFRDIVQKNRDFTVDAMRDTFAFKTPAAGFYLFFKTDEDDSFELCQRLLHEAKVGVIPGRAFGPSSTSFLRVCFARKPDVLAEGLDRIKRFFHV